MSRRDSVPVSVVICTCDRPEQARACLQHVARLDPQPLEVIVVDQGSTSFEIPAGIERVRHIRLSERGLSRARNAGIAASSAQIIAFLDDDCAVKPRWAADVAGAFARHPDAGIIFGEVIGPSRTQGMYVPVYAIAGERRLGGRIAGARAHGMGAAMYVRAAAAPRVGGFDPVLGAGSSFYASEDWDYTFRALAAGVIVVETPTITVLHHGARRDSDGTSRDLLRRNAFSHGAVHAKLLRCLDAIAVVLIASEMVAMLALLRPLNALRRKPTNVARLLMYAAGFTAGLRAPVDVRGRIFLDPRQPIRSPVTESA